MNTEGVPLYHRVLGGDVVDKVTVAGNMQSLRRALKTSGFLLVGDRGIVTKKNIARMQDKGVGYLGSYQLDDKAKKMVRGIPEEEFKLLGYKSRNGGGYYGVDREIGFRYKGGEYNARAIVIKSMEKTVEDEERRGRDMEKLRAGLKDVGARLNKRKYKRREYVQGRIDKLFSGKKRKYKKFFDIRLEGEDGALELEYPEKKEAIEEEAKLDGKYILVTDQEFSMDEALATYKSRNLIEARIKNFKHTIKVRPLFLQSDERIASLVFVNVLALIAYSVLELLARRSGMEAMTARRLLDGFRGLSVIFLQMKDGTRQALMEEPTPWQGEVIERLGFPSPGSIITPHPADAGLVRTGVVREAGTSPRPSP